MVLGNTYRHPALVANMGATLDHLARGRFVLGLGAGWHEQEHAMYGIAPAADRRADHDARRRGAADQGAVAAA